MTSLYDILKANRLGMDSDLWTAILGEAWKASEEDFKEYTGLVPYTFIANGQPLLDWYIKGNTVQNGTPTPSNPVDVNGVGERTENLWNESYTGIKIDVITYKPLNVGDGDYTLSSTVTVEGQVAVLFLLAGNVSSGATTANNGVWNGQSRTVTAVNGYVTIGYRKYTEANPENANTMLNSGSTAKPYEPYGYKIPISNGQQTTNIYLGSTQTERQIQKLVLTGQEDWEDATIPSQNTYRYRITLPTNSLDGSVVTALSTHFVYYYGSEGIGFNIGSTGTTLYIRTTYPTKEDFKSWLAQQYAAGTPVCVWCVLATPETATLNEPLMKIGTYADTLSMEQAGVEILTNRGINTIDIDTDIKPSEFYMKWKER